MCTFAAVLQGHSFIQADNGFQYPFSVIAGAGLIAYYKPNGDVWTRTIDVAFNDSLPGSPGWQHEDLFGATPVPANPLQFRDTDAGLHYSRVILTVGSASFSGMNANDPGFVTPCLLHLVGSGQCLIPGPPFTSDYTYANSAAGTIRIRAFPVGPRFSVTCAPTSPAHGTTVTCTGTLTPADSFTVVHRVTRMTTDTATIVSDGTLLPIASGQSFVWSGSAVVGTAVQVSIVTQQGATPVQLTDSTSFDVAARVFSPIAVQGATPLLKVVNPICMRSPPVPRITDAAGQTRPSCWGMALYTRPSTRRQLAAQLLGAVSSGPDSGLVYFAQSMQMPDADSVFVHPALFSTATGADSIWRADQDGVPSTPPPGTCTLSQIDTLAVETIRHEGATHAANSHYGIVMQALGAMKLEDSLAVLTVPRFDTTAALFCSRTDLATIRLVGARAHHRV